MRESAQSVAVPYITWPSERAPVGHSKPKGGLMHLTAEGSLVDLIIVNKVIFFFKEKERLFKEKYFP